MSHSIVFTAFEKRHSYGAGALLNSLFHNGYTGQVFFFIRGSKPNWIDKTLHRKLNDAGIELDFKLVEEKRHLGYCKPFFANYLFDKYDDADVVCYADPDIVFLKRWDFFQQWAEAGFGVVMDCNYGLMPNTHPWRNFWRNWAASVNIDCSAPQEYYANSGFFIASRQSRSLLNKWQEVVEARENQEPGSTGSFKDGQRGVDPTAGDQDALAIAMMADPTTLSWVGPEGMGFTGEYFILSHAAEKQKPWDKRPLLEAIVHRKKVTECFKHWLRYTTNPAQVLSSREERMMRWSTFAAKTINTIIKK